MTLKLFWKIFFKIFFLRKYLRSEKNFLPFYIKHKGEKKLSNYSHEKFFLTIHKKTHFPHKKNCNYSSLLSIYKKQKSLTKNKNLKPISSNCLPKMRVQIEPFFREKISELKENKINKKR